MRKNRDYNQQWNWKLVVFILRIEEIFLSKSSEIIYIAQSAL